MWILCELYLNKTVQRTGTTYESPGLKHKLVFPSSPSTCHMKADICQPAHCLHTARQRSIEKDVDLVQKELTSVISSAGISIRNSHLKKESSYNFNKFHSSTHGFFFTLHSSNNNKKPSYSLKSPKQKFLKISTQTESWAVEIIFHAWQQYQNRKKGIIQW